MDSALFDNHSMDGPRNGHVHYVRVAPRLALGGPSFQSHVQFEAVKLETAYRQTKIGLLLTNASDLPGQLPTDAIFEDIRAEYSSRNPRPSRRMQMRFLAVACRYTDAFLGSQLKGTGEGKTRYVVRRYVELACKAYVERFGGEVEELRQGVGEMRRVWMEVQMKAFKERGCLVVWEGGEEVDAKGGADDVLADGDEADLGAGHGARGARTDMADEDYAYEPSAGLVQSPPRLFPSPLDSDLILPSWLPQSIRSRYFSDAALKMVRGSIGTTAFADMDDLKLTLFHHTLLAIWHVTVNQRERETARRMVECLTEGYGIAAAAREHAVHSDAKKLIRGMMLTPEINAGRAMAVIERLMPIFPLLEARLEGVHLERFLQVQEQLGRLRGAEGDDIKTGDDRYDFFDLTAEASDTGVSERATESKGGSPVFEDPVSRATSFDAKTYSSPPTAPKAMLEQQRRKEMDSALPKENAPRPPPAERIPQGPGLRISGTALPTDGVRGIHPSRRSLFGIGEQESGPLMWRSEARSSQCDGRDQYFVHPSRRSLMYDEMPQLFVKRRQ